MDLLFKLLLLVAGLAALLSLNLWFIQTALHTFGSRVLPDTIAPLTLIGADQKDSATGQALAGMLLSKLGKLREDMSTTEEQLRTPLTDPSGIGRQDARDAVPLPTGLLQPLDLEMKVGGVEVGGLLSWLHRALTRDDSLRLSVENANGRAIVSGFWNDGRDTLWVEVTGTAGQPVSNERVASAIAYALAQKQFETRVVGVRALTAQEFEELLDVIGDVAALNRQVAWGRAADSDFSSLFDRIEKLLVRTPKWRELVHFSARLADRAGRSDRAISLYRDTLALLEPGDSDLRVDLNKRMASLSAQGLAQVATPVDTASVTPQASPALASWPLSALGVADLKMPTAVRIGILGGVPTRGTLDPDRIEIVGSNEGAQTDPAMAEYIRTVVQAIDMVAPKARFVFSASTAKNGLYMGDQALLELDTLAKAKPDILLITVGPLDPVFAEDFFGRLYRTMVLVFPAGVSRDEPPPFAGTLLAERVLVAASVNPAGQASSFSPQGASVVWTPGELIPLRPVGDKLQTRSGTVYSAAFAAGVAARVLAENVGMRPELLIDLLKRSSRPLAGGGKPVIQLEGALEQVRTLVKAQASRPPSVSGTSNPNRRIPDNDRSGLVDSIQLTGSGTVKDLKVSLDIEHTYIGDLTVTLTAPDGKKAVLHDRNGGSAKGLKVDYESPFDVHLVPLVGASVAGAWKLQVRDSTAGDVGTLKGWSLTAYTAPPPAAAASR